MVLAGTRKTALRAAGKCAEKWEKRTLGACSGTAEGVAKRLPGRILGLCQIMAWRQQVTTRVQGPEIIHTERVTTQIMIILGHKEQDYG